jgi:hypothetical protein
MPAKSFTPTLFPPPSRGRVFIVFHVRTGWAGSFTEVFVIIFLNLTSCQFIYFYVLITLGYKEEGPYGKTPTVFIKFFAGIP